MMLSRVGNEQLSLIRPPGSFVHSAGLHDELYGYVGISGPARSHAGIVLYDKVDNNFSYVLFKRTQGGTFEHIDNSVDFKTVEEADEALRYKLCPIDISDNLLERSRQRQLHIDRFLRETKIKRPQDYLPEKVLIIIKVQYELLRQSVETTSGRRGRLIWKRQYEQARNKIKSLANEDNFLKQLHGLRNHENQFCRIGAESYLDAIQREPNTPHFSFVDQVCSTLAISQINLMSVDLVEHTKSQVEVSGDNAVRILNHMPSNPFYVEFDRDLFTIDDQPVVGVLLLRYSGGIGESVEYDFSDYKPFVPSKDGQHVAFTFILQTHEWPTIRPEIIGMHMNDVLSLCEKQKKDYTWMKIGGDEDPVWILLSILDYCSNVHINYVHIGGKGGRKKRKPKHKKKKNDRESVVRYHYREERTYQVNRFDDDDVDHILNTIVIPGIHHRWLYCPNCQSVHKWSLLNQHIPCRECGFTITPANVTIKKIWHQEHTRGSGPLKEVVREHRHIK